MASRSSLAAVLLSIATVAFIAQARQLRSEAPADDAACSTAWTATFRQQLANTLLSSPRGFGEAAISLMDEDALYFTASFAETHVKGLDLHFQQTAQPPFVIELPTMTQISSRVEGFIQRNATDNFDIVVAALQSGEARIHAQIAAPEDHILVGILTPDCDLEQLTEIVVEWEEPAPGDSIPDCDDPNMSELYEIPETCTDFPRLVQQYCGIHPEAVMVASSHGQNGSFLGYGLSDAACLPKGCDPCAASTISPRIPDKSFVVKGEPGCQKQGFLARYKVPQTCNDFPQRLQDFCGLNLAQVLQASSHDAYGQMLGLDLQSTVCLPEDCDPCAPYLVEPTPVMSVEPDCSSSNYFFTKAYSIPAGCDYVPEALEVACGVTAEAVAEASGHPRYPQYAGFGEGRTICVPDTCDPCAGEGDVSVALRAASMGFTRLLQPLTVGGGFIDLA